MEVFFRRALPRLRIDIQPECKRYARDGIEVFIGDQGNRAFWREFKARVPKVDIVVDDGSHLPEHQIVTLEEMLPHVWPEGVYLCEDIEKQDRPHPLLAFLLPLVDELSRLPLSLEMSSLTCGARSMPFSQASIRYLFTLW